LIEDIPSPDDIDSYSSSAKYVDSVIKGIAIIHILASILTFPLVYAIFTSTIFQAPVSYISLLLVEGAVLVVTIPLYIVLGIAIWLVQRWAWKVAIIVHVICLIFNLFGAVILTAILNIVLLLALNSTDVKLALQPADQ